MQRFERKQPAPDIVEFGCGLLLASPERARESADFQLFVDYGIPHTSLDRRSMPQLQL
jgi:hypothetical protein